MKHLLHVFALAFVLIAEIPIWAANNIVPPAAAVTPAWPGEEGREAWDKLGAYYADKKAVIPWQDALDAMDSPDAGASARAGNFLAALFAQSFSDEQNGRARWQSLPYWGGGAQSDARDFRAQLAGAFGKSAKSPAALPAVRWLLETERVAGSQEASMTVLRRVRTPEADALLLEQLVAPHPNAAVLRAAIEEAGLRKLGAAAPSLEKLCVHYRADIRDAARNAPALLGEKNPPPYNPIDAFSPSLAATLHDIVRMAPTVSAGAAWRVFAQKENGDDDSDWLDEPKTFSGWLCNETENDFTVLDYFAQKRTLPKAAWTATDESLGQTAQRLLAMRASPSDKTVDQLSRRGGLTAQFEPGQISIPEILTAAWLFERGERAACAGLLFPRLEILSDERWLREIARNQIGRVAHEEMLVDFSERRDYPAALALARRLADSVFDGYSYQERAVELAAQLERSTKDFHTLALPVPDEWARMKTTMSREDAIRFLAARLRLLNCIQWGQPGGVDYDDIQYQTPMKGEVPRDKRIQVINPFTELKDMQLTPSELKLLVPYLAQRDFIPTFSYWRDFHPARTLHRVSWVAGYIINDAAKRNLADLATMETQDEAAQADHLAEIMRWCDEHAALSASDLLLDTLRLTTVGNYQQWIGAITESARQKLGDRAAEIICDRANEFPKASADAAEGLYYLRSEKALPLARQWLAHQNRNTRFWSALLILALDKNTPQQKTLAVLDEGLSQDTGNDLYPQAIPELLACKTPDATQLALGILQRPDFLRWETSATPILHRFLLAGYDKAYACVLERLDDSKPSGHLVGEWEGKRVEQDLCVYDDMAAMAKDWRKDWNYPSSAPEDVRKQRVAELKAWLIRQQGKIKRGESSEFVQTPKPIPVWFKPYVDAP